MLKVQQTTKLIAIEILTFIMLTCVLLSVSLFNKTIVHAATFAQYSFEMEDELNNFSSLYNVSQDGVIGVEEDFSVHWQYDESNGYITSVRPGDGETDIEKSVSLVFKKYVFENFEAEIVLSFNSESWGWAGLQFRKNITSSGYVSDGCFAFVQKEGFATINGSDEFISGTPIQADSISGEFDSREPFLLFVKVVNKRYDIKVMTTDKSLVYSSVSGQFNSDDSIKNGYLVLTSIDNSHRFYSLNLKNLDNSGNEKPLVANSTKEYSFDTSAEMNDFVSIYSTAQQSDSAEVENYANRWTLSDGKITSSRAGTGATDTDKSVSLLLKKYKFVNFSASVAMSFRTNDGNWGWGGLQLRKFFESTGWRYDSCLVFAQREGYSSLFGCDDFDNTIVSDETYEFDDALFNSTNYFLLNIKVVGANITVSISLNGVIYTRLTYQFTKFTALRLGYVALTSIDNSHDFYAFKITNLDNDGNPIPLELESGEMEISPFELDPSEESEMKDIHNWIYENINESSENTVLYEFDSYDELNDFISIACKDEYGEGEPVDINSYWTLSDDKITSTRLNMGGSESGNVLSLVLNKYDFCNFKAEIVIDYNTVLDDMLGSWGWGGLQFRKTNIYYGWNIKGAFAFAQESGKATIWGSQEYVLDVQEASSVVSGFNPKSQFKLAIKVLEGVCAVEVSSVNGSKIYSNIKFNLDGTYPINTGFVSLTSVDNSHDFYSLKITNLDKNGNPIALTEHEDSSVSPDTSGFSYDFTAMTIDEIDQTFYASYIKDERGGGAHPLSDYWVKTAAGTLINKTKKLTTKDSAKNFMNLYFKDFKAIDFEATVVYRDTNPVGKGFIGFAKNYKSVGWRFLEDGVGMFLQRDGIATVWGEKTMISENYEKQSSYNLNEWHTLKIRAYGEKVEFFLDENIAYAVREGVEQKNGYIGLLTSSTSVFEIKGINIKHLDEDGNELNYSDAELTINNKIFAAVSGAGQSYTLNISGTTDYHIESSDVNVAFINGDTIYFCAPGEVMITVICDHDSNIKDSMTITVG